MCLALVVAAFVAAAWAAVASADLSPAPPAPAPAPAPVTQTAGQIATNDQSAQASAASGQVAPQNTNVNVRVLSPGGNGSVDQSNSSTAAAIGANANLTGQDISQGGGSSQQAGQEADSGQGAAASAASGQVNPQNTNVDVRVLSPGDDGSVSQANTSTAAALAGNLNATGQEIGQYGDPSGQTAGQAAGNWQGAQAGAVSAQLGPSNTNAGASVLSPGNSGDVSQANTSTAIGAAVNANLTKQKIDQSPSAPTLWTGPSQDGGVGVQAAGQLAGSEQSAIVCCASSVQVAPSNTNLSGDGSTKQDNSSTALGVAANINGLGQTIGQGPADHKASDPADPAPQAAPMLPKPTPSVDQSNTSTALGLSANLNLTHQSITQQQQDGHPSGTNVQAAGQQAGNKQDASSSAQSWQIAPSNSNGTIGVLGGCDKQCGPPCPITPPPCKPVCPKPPPVCTPSRQVGVVPVT
jgi:hypothetical protein